MTLGVSLFQYVECQLECQRAGLRSESVRFAGSGGDVLVGSCPEGLLEHRVTEMQPGWLREGLVLIPASQNRTVGLTYLGGFFPFGPCSPSYRGSSGQPWRSTPKSPERPAARMER